MHDQSSTLPSDFWFDGHNLFLNELLGEEVADPEDPRLSESEQQALSEAIESAACSGNRAVLEFLAGDPRSDVQHSANNCAIRLSSLNHDPSSLRAALLTSFDLIDDVQWLQEELRLPTSAAITFCMHPWTGKHDGVRKRMIEEMKTEFEDVVVHFPGEREASRKMPNDVRGCSTENNRTIIDTSSGCSVHAKLLMFEFEDRLRIVVTSANLKRLHWGFLGETVWVQDFPRVPVTGDATCRHNQIAKCDAGNLFKAGPFARTLVHFVADVLNGSERERRKSWVEKLALFDLSSASVQLVLSLPGLFVPAHKLKSSEMMLRIQAETAPGCDCSSLVLKHRRASTWELHSSASEPPAFVGKLVPSSVSALNAAQRLGLQVCSETELLPTGTEEIRKLYGCSASGNNDTVEASSSFWHSLQSNVRSLIHKLRSRLLPQKETLVVRVTVSGDCSGKWADSIADLACCMDVNYGLFALREQLGSEVWLQGEEREFAAITGSITWPDDAWLQKFDYFISRTRADGPSGPAVLAPGGCGPIEVAHQEFHRRGQLFAQSPPAHAPGRELVRNHSKVLVRRFWDAHRSELYGWIYAGSHNLTKAAWGELYDEDQERLWVGNRELGVLFLRSRAASINGSKDNSNFACNDWEKLMLPFGFPLEYADIEGRDVHEWSDTEEEAEGWWERAPDGTWIWKTGGWDWWQWQQDDSDDDDDWEPRNHEDWRLRTSSWWWWTGS